MSTEDTVNKLADAIESLIAFFSPDAGKMAQLQSDLNAANQKIAELQGQVGQPISPEAQAKADKAVADAATALNAPNIPPVPGQVPVVEPAPPAPAA